MEVNTKVAFFIDKKRTKVSDGSFIPREVTAVFVESGNYLYKDCYAHVGQHGTCGVDWLTENCRPARYAEYIDLYTELTNRVGYQLDVMDAEMWIEQAMAHYNAIQEYYKGTRNKAA